VDGAMSDVERPLGSRDNVVPFPGARAANRPRVVRVHARMGALAFVGRLLRAAVVLALQAMRFVALSMMVLMEPLVRLVLVPAALLGCLVTLLFGFLMGDPRFPRWGMLALSLGALWLYWAYLGLLCLLMGRS
jgi:hypothetical protein